jgi:hypothetical protein
MLRPDTCRRYLRLFEAGNDASRNDPLSVQLTAINAPAHRPLYVARLLTLRHIVARVYLHSVWSVR